MLSLTLNRTKHEKIILLFLNKTRHEKIILLFHESWVLFQANMTQKVVNQCSWTGSWIKPGISFARYVLRPGACFRHGVKEIKPVPAHHTCFHNLEQLAERANTRCDVTILIKWDKTSMRLTNRHQKRHSLFIETRSRQDCKLQYSRLVWGGCGCWVTWVTQTWWLELWDFQLPTNAGNLKFKFNRNTGFPLSSEWS